MSTAPETWRGRVTNDVRWNFVCIARWGLKFVQQPVAPFLQNVWRECTNDGTKRAWTIDVEISYLWQDGDSRVSGPLIHRMFMELGAQTIDFKNKFVSWDRKPPFPWCPSYGDWAQTIHRHSQMKYMILRMKVIWVWVWLQFVYEVVFVNFGIICNITSGDSVCFSDGFSLTIIIVPMRVEIL